jgi:hypothetical protein
MELLLPKANHYSASMQKNTASSATALLLPYKVQKPQ